MFICVQVGSQGVRAKGVYMTSN